MSAELLPFDEVAALIAAASAIGVLLLTPLYLSQRRDVRRLREWMFRDPGYAASDLRESEERLDRTERELERIYAERGEPVPGTGATAVQPPRAGAEPTLVRSPLPASARVTSERPALERITMEQAALAPHPRWRRFAAAVTQPRWLAAIGLVALATAAAAIIITQGVLQNGGEAGVDVDPGGIEVAVLNTTEASGLAGQVARRIERSGFLPGAVQTFARDADQSVVMYEQGQRRAARRVARELGGVAVQPIDRQVERAAPTANVVVILGADQLVE